MQLIAQSFDPIQEYCCFLYDCVIEEGDHKDIKLISSNVGYPRVITMRLCKISRLQSWAYSTGGLYNSCNKNISYGILLYKKVLAIYENRLCSYLGPYNHNVQYK